MGAHERALVLLLFSAASTGLIYVSSVYSQALKDTLDLSQDDIETISLSCYLGGLFGFLPGRVSDVMGTRKTIVFGGGAQGLLLFVFWLVAKKLVVVPAPLPLLCVLTFLQYLSSGCTVAAVFSALSRLYGENRGVVVGMGKAYVGMVGAIVTQIYHGIVPSASDGAAVDFILVTGLASLALCWIPALLLDADELREPHPERHRRRQGPQRLGRADDDQGRHLLRHADRRLGPRDRRRDRALRPLRPRAARARLPHVRELELERGPRRLQRQHDADGRRVPPRVVRHRRRRVQPARELADAQHSVDSIQPLVWGVPTKLQNSLSRSNRSRFG